MPARGTAGGGGSVLARRPSVGETARNCWAVSPLARRTLIVRRPGHRCAASRVYWVEFAVQVSAPVWHAETPSTAGLNAMSIWADPCAVVELVKVPWSRTVMSTPELLPEPERSNDPVVRIWAVPFV